MALPYFWYTERKNAPSTAASGTATYDLPKKGWIPKLTLTAYSTPTASTDGALPLNKAITKIEIVDGGKTIVNLTANQVMGIYLHEGVREYNSPEVNDNAVEGHECFHILLARKVDGTQYCPDFGKFINPQIKITWDYSQTTGQFGATYDADTAPVMKFTIFAKIFPTSQGWTHGYARSREIYTFTQATSTTTHVDIPVKERLMGIMIEAGYDAKHWIDDINELKVSFDAGAWVPIDAYAEEIELLEAEMYGTAKVSWMQDTIDAVEYDMHMGYITAINGTALSSAGRVFEYDGTHDGVEAVGFMDAATPTAISTYELVYIQVEGYMPYQCLYLPMREFLGDGRDAIKIGEFSECDLKLVSSGSASTSSTPSVIVETLITE